MVEYAREIYEVLKADNRLDFYHTSPPWHYVKGTNGHVLAAMLGVPHVPFAAAGMQWWDLIIFPTPHGVKHFHPAIPKLLCTHHTVGGDARDGVDILYGRPETMRDGKSVFEKVFEASERTCRMVERSNPGLAGRMKAVGDLKIDKMLRLNSRRREIRRQLGFRDDDVVVLIQSTWRDTSLIERMGRQLISEAISLLPLGKYKFILSIHPNYWGDSPYAREHPWGAFCEQQEREGLIVKRPTDPWERFHVVSDLAISDHTSLVAAFAMLHRPIYFVPLPEGLFLDDAIVPQLARVAPLLSDPTKLWNVLEKDHSDYPMNEITKIAEQIDSYPGRAEQRIKEEIYDLLPLEMPN